MGHFPGHLDMAWLAERSGFVAWYRRRLLGWTGTGVTLMGRLLTVQVVEWRTAVPPLWLGLLEW